MAICEMVQDLADDAGLGDERNDAHFAAAVFANQRVGFEHTTEQVGPSSAKGFTLCGVELAVVGCGAILSGLLSSSSGIVPVVEDRMLMGLRDVDEHPGEEVERVEELGLSVFGSGLIENVVALFVVMEPLKGDGAANDIAAESFESLGVGGIEVDIIVDAKAASAPGTEELDAFVREEVVFL